MKNYKVVLFSLYETDYGSYQELLRVFYFIKAAINFLFQAKI